MSDEPKFDPESFDFDQFEAKEDKTVEERAIWLCLLNMTCPCCWQAIRPETKLGKQIMRSLAKNGTKRDFDPTHA
jgi:hypothetical protein